MPESIIYTSTDQRQHFPHLTIHFGGATARASGKESLMLRTKQIVIVALSLAFGLVFMGSSRAEDPKKRPLSEADLLVLLNLGLDDDCIVARLKRGGIAFKADDAVLARLKKAGASPEVLAALRRKEPLEYSKRPILTFRGDLKELSRIVFSPDGKTLALAGKGFTVELWDTTTGKLRAERKHPAEVTCLAFSPDSKTLAVGYERQLQLWNTVTGEKRHTLKGHTDPVWLVQFTPDSKTLISRDESWEADVRLWDVTTGEKKRTLAIEPGRSFGPTFMKVLSTDERWARFYDGGSRAISPDGSITVRRSRERMLNLGTAKTGSLPEADYLIFSPDSATVFLSKDKTVKRLEVATGRPHKIHSDHTSWISSLALSPDQKVLATGSQDKTAILWDLEANKCRATLEGHRGLVQVCFSRDGKLLCSFSPYDRTVKLWDVRTGKARASLGEEDVCVRLVAFSPTNNLLAVAWQDDVVQLWDTDRLPPPK